MPSKKYTELTKKPKTAEEMKSNVQGCIGVVFGVISAVFTISAIFEVLIAQQTRDLRLLR